MRTRDLPLRATGEAPVGLTADVSPVVDAVDEGVVASISRARGENV